MSGLYYIIGASGVGKDTLLSTLQSTLNEKKYVFMKRYITRDPSKISQKGVNEDYHYISNEEFLQKKKNGFFAFSWHSHNNYYGISKKIEDELKAGKTIFVNGSREYLPLAKQLYPNLTPVLIEVKPEILKKRLLLRGREAGKELQGRIHQANICVEGECIRLDNSGNLEDFIKSAIIKLKLER